ncbi:MAG: hypothetical protein E7166_04760 [Firmicutes bacterium]|nr:hypothetical protein [Bacillota bacterium]
MLDKIKNLFYEEEVVEVPKEEKKATIIIKEDLNEEKKDEMDEVVSERDLLKSETTFKFPVIFEDEDFADMEKEKKKLQEQNNRKPEVREQQSSKYRKPTLDREVIREVIEKPKKFKPSPVISPVYGVLDKKGDENSNSRTRSSSLEDTKEMVINFDTIRQKAYGSLTDDIENELAPRSKNIDDIEKEIDSILGENNLLSDLEEKTVEVNNVSVEEDNDEYNYSDFGVEYKIDNSESIDSDKKAPKKEENDEVKEKKDKEVELTEDLFNLIDSMYDR